jgi:hypothetical protein
LLIGDVSRPEFYEACAALDEAARMTLTVDTEAALAALHDGQVSPHAIVLVQAHPGQFPPQAIERLRAAAPLARLIALLGSWCEGEPRSGRPLPGVVRVYWHEAAVRFRGELPRWFARGSVWSLPITVTDEERTLATVSPAKEKGDSPVFVGTKTGTVPGGLVAIWTRRREMADLLADACRSGCYATVWLHPRLPSRVQGAAAAIFDGDSLDPVTVNELKRFIAHVSPAPVLVLLGAPRIQDVRLVQSLGGTVLPKPFRIDELLSALEPTAGRANRATEDLIENISRKGAKPQRRKLFHEKVN